MSRRLEELLKKREQLNAQIHQARAFESAQNRKEDTRRKILLGALMMQMMSKGELDRDLIRKRLSEFLTRESDRKLFELPTEKKESVELTDQVNQSVEKTRSKIKS